MIKILKEGTRRKIECDGCGAKLRFDESDIRSDGIRYCVGFIKYINCPQCKRKIILNKAK